MEIDLNNRKCVLTPSLFNPPIGRAPADGSQILIVTVNAEEAAKIAAMLSARAKGDG
jgi:hypothetical protein